MKVVTELSHHSHSDEIRMQYLCDTFAALMISSKINEIGKKGNRSHFATTDDESTLNGSINYGNCC